MITVDDPFRLPADQKRALLRRLLGERATRPAEWPLSHGQRALWFLHQFNPDSAAYNVPFAVRVGAGLDVAALRQALQELTDRHALLRATFQPRNGEPVQIIHPQRDVAIEQVDASTWSEDELRERVSRAAYQPFDLDIGPLFRGTIFRRAADDHVLLFTVHHIIADFWSLVVIMAELRQLYQRGREDRRSPLPKPATQYLDYLRWQQTYLESADGTRLWDYWRQELSGELPLLNLPTDHPFPPLQTDRGAAVNFQLDDTLSTALKSLARAEGVTLFHVLLAAYQLLLSRYCGQSDVLVGSPTASRSKPEFESIVGYFTNIVVFRGHVDGHTSFRDFLHTVRQTVLDGLKHQDFPFALLVERLQPIRNPSRSPIYQAAFLMEKSHRSEAQGAAALMMGQAGTALQFGGMALEPFGLRAEATPFELAMIVEETDRNLVGCLQFNADLFDAATMDRWAAGYAHVLREIVADPARPLAAVSVLPAAERACVVDEWNATQTDFPHEICLHELFDAQVARAPDAVAVTSGDQQITYRELSCRANRLAHHLRSLGACPGHVVGICTERNIDMAVAVLGVMRSGAAYLPLDPALPRERLAYMLADSRAAILVTQQSLADELPPFSGTTVCLDRDAAAIAVQPAAPPSPAAGPEDLVYVIYTSGSTGRPKGVQITHRALVNFLTSMRRESGLTADDCLLSVTTLSFDICALELYLPLLVGARVVLVDRVTAADPIRLIRELEDHRATVMQATPATWQMLVSAGWTGAPSLKILVGGEALPPDLARALLARGGELWNLYGPTETTVWSTLERIRPDFDRIAIGNPIANTQIYILDANLEPVPIGVAGELCIGGAGLARGYLGRPELTAERFIPNPFAPAATHLSHSSRLYRTGDLARRLADGRLELLGRSDYQVKVRGFRIELGEIETALTSHPAVRQAVVVARRDASGQNCLVAYVVGGDDGAIVIDDLRAHLRQRLPDYMLPAAFVELTALPRTANGKVDRNALPAPDISRRAASSDYVAPRTPTEELLAGMWADLLKLERVGIYDNFFELGGHSLLATQVVSRLRQQFQGEIPLRELFETPTIANLAATLDRQRGGGSTATAIAPADRAGPLPLSFAQERLWFLDQFEPNSPLYNIPAAVRITGPLDIAALRTALAAIVERHESLRTSFANRDGRPELHIARECATPLNVIDLTSFNPEDQPREVGRLAAAEACRPFDLAAAPLFRVLLLRRADADHVFILSMHHIVSDGWSMGVFLRELLTLYEAFTTGRSSPLRRLDLQYVDYAAWQRRALSDESLQRQVDYWCGQLHDAPPTLDLPTDRPRPPVQTYAGAVVTSEIPFDLTAALHRASRREGCTLFMTLLAGFQTLLGRHAGQHQVCVGTPIAGRTQAQFEHLIGLFLNTLVLRGDFADNPTFAELLARTRETTLAAYANQDVPFERLVDELRPTRDLGRNPLFQVMFVLQNAPLPTANLRGVKLEPLEVHSGTSKFDITLMVEETPTGLRASWEYNSDLFDHATIERLADRYKRQLAAMVADPSSKVLDIDFLGPERQTVVGAFNATERAYPAGETLRALFYRQAAATPGAVAVRCGDETLSYAELERRGHQVGQWLVARGIGPDAVVGVLAERSVAMLAAIYGALSAGAAYLPLEPDAPPQRLAAILEEARPAAVLYEAAWEATLKDYTGPRLALDREWDACVAPLPAVAPAVELKPEHLAYVIYTSGSTGTPKGAMVAHGAIVNRLRWMQDYYGLDSGDRVLQKTPIGFDVSVWELFWPLQCGAALVLARPGGHKDPAYLAELIERERITTLHFVPSMLAAFLEEPSVPARCASVKRVIASGEALPYRLVARFYERLPGAVLENLYGPTEAAVDVTRYACPKSDPRGIVPIGSPVANTRCYVLDAQLQPVPVGTPGELYLGGVQLARGYYRRAALSAERFVPDPFSLLGGRLYKTGDRARWLVDGTLEYLGRLDGQVKIRGQRIELGEVEAALAALPGVAAAAAAVREQAGEKFLVGYLVPAEGATLDVEAARTALSKKLSAAMIPAAFRELAALPISANGKVERRRLPAVDLSARSAQRPYVAPRGAREAQLAAVFARVLGVDQVGVEDNYFALGGDSIRAIQLVAQAQAAGVVFSLAELFRAPTVAELAALSLGRVAEAAVPRTAAFSLIGAADRAALPAEVEDAYPLVELQAGMLFHSALSPETAVYHDVFASRVSAELDEDRLRAALERLMRRHAVLRTGFALSGFSRPLQLVARQAAAPLEVFDLTALAAAQQEAALEEWLEREKGRPFDFSRAPLFRLVVHRLAAKRFQLALSFHHAILDGWSVATLLAELFGEYEGEKVQAPQLAYRDYVALEQAAVASPAAARYWEELLAGSAPLRLPRSPRAGRTTAPGRLGVVERALDAALVHKLKELAVTSGVPLKSVLLAAHLRVLALVTGQQDVLSGVVAHGRPEEADGQRLLGLFLNTLPLRMTVGAADTGRALLQRVFAAEQAGLPHRRYPAGRLKHQSGEAPFEAAFNYNHFHVYESLAGRTDLELSDPKIFERTNYTLVASFQQTPDTTGVTLSLTYDAGQLTADQVDAMAGYYRRALESVAAAPDRPLAIDDLLSAEERRTVVIEWNETAEAASADTVEVQVAQRAAEQPDELAIVAGDRRVTYGQLDEQANRLAQHLRQAGVGPGKLAAIFLDRSPELVVGALAVLKTGGAYVPIDPSYPAERVDFMVADSNATVVLTSVSLRDRLPTTRQIICLDTDWAAIERASPPPPTAALRGLAYVIYTSGSTGRPKGVAVEHANLANLVAWHRREYGVTPHDRVSLVAAPGFDASVWEIWANLTAGASLYIPDEPTRNSPTQLAEWLEREAITLAFAPTPLAEMLLERSWPREIALRVLFTGGDRLRRRPAQGLPFRVANLYGPTENTVVSTAADVESTDDGLAPSIGRPIANTHAYVLDGALMPVPIGTPGELYVGGAGVARGYLGRPEMTAERFVPDPFSTRSGARLYRTGDRARWLPDGRLDFMGRFDGQLKVRGFRIELGEIEAVLAEHPAVAAAVVAAWPDASGQQRLVGYVVWREAAATDAVVDHLRRRLPHYMTPSEFVTLAELPLTEHGKVDRRRLPAPTGETRSTREYVAPRTPVEQMLADVWQRLLGVEQVGVHDNFFALGGDSLSAMRMAAEAEREAGVRLPLRRLFESNTLERLAEAIDGQQRAADLPLVPLQPPQPGTNRPPLFVVHPAEGTVLGYMQLSRRLGADQPFYALQAPGLESETEPITSVELLAAHYIEAMRRVQPTGPYLLAGWSFGGLVAFEMAQQLTARNERVAWLGLIDSFIVSGTTGALPELDRRRFASGARQYLEQLGMELPLAEEELAEHEPGAQVDLVLERLRAAGMDIPAAVREQAENLLKLWQINAAAATRYVPQPYDGSVALFRATEVEADETGRAPDAAAQWAAVSRGPFAVYELAGNHTSIMLRPEHLDGLAARLSESLASLELGSTERANDPHSLPLSRPREEGVESSKTEQEGEG